MKQILLVFLISLLCFPAFSENSWESSFPDEETVTSELKVYPNPCKTNKVTIDFGTDEIIEIRLTNITGRQVLLKKYNIPEHKIQLSLNNIPNGIYLVRVKSINNEIIVKKLMVSKN